MMPKGWPPAQEPLLRPRSRRSGSQSADVGPRRGAAAESRSRHIRRSDRRARRLRSRSHKVHSASGCGPRSHRDCQRAPACGLRAGLALSRRSLRSVDGGFEDVRDVSSGRGKRRANWIGSCLENRSSSSPIISFLRIRAEPLPRGCGCGVSRPKARSHPSPDPRNKAARRFSPDRSLRPRASAPCA